MSPRWLRFWTLVAFVFAVVLTLPPSGMTIYYKLDPAWIYALNAFPEIGVMFGRDVVFTYGPLGYLISPMQIHGSTVIDGLHFRLLVHLLVACFLLLAFMRTRFLIQSWLFAMASVTLVFTGLPILEAEIELLMALWACEAIVSRRGWLLCLEALLAAFLLFTKLTLGLEGVAVVAVSLLVYRDSWRTKVGLGAGCLLVWAGCTAALIHLYMPGYFQPWLHGCLQIVGSYSDAMSSVGLGYQINSIAVSFVLLVAFGCWVWKRRSRIGAAAMPVLALAFLVVKHGVVRQDMHVLLATTMLAYLAAVLMLHASDESEINLAAALVALVVCMQVGFSVQGELAGSSVGNVATQWMMSAGQLFHPYATQQEVIAQNAQIKPPWPLSPESVTALQQSRGCTMLSDTIPYCYPYALPYRPLPTIQDYLATTTYLDNLDASFFAGPQRPGAILLDHTVIDERNLLYSAPRMWRAIFGHYAMVGERERNYVVAVANGQPREEALHTVSADMVRAEQWIDLPQTDAMIYASARLELTLHGKVAAAFYHIPWIQIDVLDAAGKYRFYRVPPGVLPDGVPVNHLPNDTEQLADLFNGLDKASPILKFRLWGPGLKYYRQPFKLTVEADQNFTVHRPAGAAAVRPE